MGVRDDSRNSLIVGKMFEHKLPRMHFNADTLREMLHENGIKLSKVKEIKYLGDRIIGLTEGGVPFKIYPVS